MSAYAIGGCNSVSYHHPVDPQDSYYCAMAVGQGQREDAEFFRKRAEEDAFWSLPAPEWRLRATNGFEFRGVMLRAGHLGVPRDFVKFPLGVTVARRTGNEAERLFAALPHEFITGSYAQATLDRFSPAEWFAMLEKKLRGRRALVFRDRIYVGGRQ